MQRAERRLAEREGRRVRTLGELDYLLGVADETRLGALRFRWNGEDEFQAPVPAGVPALIELGRLLQITERILRDEETDEDLQLIFAPGSPLGGARPKASIIDQYGHLSIAKFPKETDEYSIEAWEEVALRLAERAGISTPHHELLQVAGKPVLLSRRFDRAESIRIPFLSAMSMTGSRDGQRGSYPELVDALTQHGAKARADAAQLYRRVTFNVLVSNVDDHLRNHGFLWTGHDGWVLSPAYAVLEKRIARVYRLGQKKPVQVINYVAKGTIEEGMLSVLAFKRSLAEGILDGGAGEILLGGSRLTRFMKDVENVTGRMGESEVMAAAEEAASGAVVSGDAASDASVVETELAGAAEQPQASTIDTAQPGASFEPWSGLLQYGAVPVRLLSIASDGSTRSSHWASTPRRASMNFVSTPATASASSRLSTQAACGKRCRPRIR